MEEGERSQEKEIKTTSETFLPTNNKQYQCSEVAGHGSGRRGEGMTSQSIHVHVVTIRCVSVEATLPGQLSL